jgi:endonuclease/exonuclease/phosphatase family metal-dependent hydrolase
MKLCLVSSNIRFDNPADGANAWPQRRSLLAETLLAHAPDVIATQEGRFAQLKDFETILPGYEIVDQHRSWIKERMYPTFFVRKNAFEILRSEDVWLSETPEVAGSASFGSAFPRLMTLLRLQPKGSDVNIVFVNTHLDHVKPETRAAQVEVLVRETRRHLSPAAALVVMGDFNDAPTSGVRRIITDAFPALVDAWGACNEIEETSHHAFTGECQNGARIDWILVDRTLGIESCFLEKRTVDGRYPSDHFPVVCRLSP